MITAWLLYAIVVGALFAAGGLVVEKLLRIHALPSRWVWAGTIVLSVGWPLAHWAWERRPTGLPVTAPVRAPPVGAAVQGLPAASPPVEPIAIPVPPESILRALDGPVAVAWALVTGVLVLFFVSLLVRTHRLRTRWRSGEVGGETVLFSDEWGPAVVGFLRPQIVLPGWCRDIDDWALRFILDHELEHVRAGDLALLLMAGILPILFPWHLPVWWQLSRLRAAAEGDCDLRVLARNPGQTRPYVDLLLEVGERCSGRRPLAAMLSEPYETLRWRIGIMTMPLPKRPWVRGGLLAGSGAFLVALACWAPGPTDERSQGTEPSAGPASRGDVEAGGDAAALPVFTPYTVLPDLKNPEEVVAALQAAYPPLLKEAGIGGTVEVWLFIDEEGRAVRAQVNQSSGDKALDDAALRVAELAEFTPALNRDQRRAVWISLPIEFTTAEAEASQGSGERTAGLPPAIEIPPPPSSGARVTGGREAEGVPPASLQTGDVTGAVTNVQTGERMASVQVWVSGTDRGALSNQKGRFLIRHVPVGEREVIAELVGYGRVSQGVSVIAGEPAEVTFALRATAIQMETLVVNGR